MHTIAALAAAVLARRKMIEAYVLMYAAPFTPTECPGDVRHGKVGTCFDTSMVNALRGKYRYVEGVARDIRTGEWMLHGWLTGERAGMERPAYDPTWRIVIENGGARVIAPIPTAYQGIVLDTSAVASFMLETGYASVIANAWRAPELARRILPGKGELFEALMREPHDKDAMHL